MKDEIPEDDHDQSQGEETAEKNKSRLEKRTEEVVPITRGIFRSYPAGPEHFGGSRGQGQSTLPTKSVRCLHSPAAVRTGGRLRRKSAAHAKAPSLRQFPAEVGLSHSNVPVGIKRRTHKHTIAASPRSS